MRNQEKAVRFTFSIDFKGKQADRIVTSLMKPVEISLKKFPFVSYFS